MGGKRLLNVLIQENKKKNFSLRSNGRKKKGSATKQSMKKGGRCA